MQILAAINISVRINIAKLQLHSELLRIGSNSIFAVKIASRGSTRRQLGHQYASACAWIRRRSKTLQSLEERQNMKYVYRYQDTISSGGTSTAIAQQSEQCAHDLDRYSVFIFVRLTSSHRVHSYRQPCHATSTH